MFRCSKPVAWRNWDEWKETYRMLYSNDVKEILWGCNRVLAWGSKQVLPIAIEVTASLLQELHNPEKNTFALSLAIIRFINGVVEPFKNANQSVPISTIGASYGVPDFVITIRHSATHGKMPSFEFASIGALSALDWLKNNYWEVQISEINSIEQTIQEQLMSFFMNSTTSFEENYPDIAMSFGINELVKLVLNKSQKKKATDLFQTKVLSLMKNLSQKKDFKLFNSCFIMKLAEETAKGNQIASSWLDFLAKSLQIEFPFENVSLILQWANPVLIGNSIPCGILRSIIDQAQVNEVNSDQCDIEKLCMLNQIRPQWPPTSIGYLPVSDNGSLTLAEDEFEFVETGEDEPDDLIISNDNSSYISTESNFQNDHHGIYKDEKKLEIW
ncbi:Ribosomal biogenesis protein las1l [Tritrichomonas musculus]|uniref:Ribosomal biogenesis protein las1l n=1 Tax=Tritrichomonas musculus TaxID=1915356 RepID=A0ABR2KEU5_9EUKA